MPNKPLTLVLRVAGASHAELERGIAAAMQVFVKRGLTPTQAAAGEAARETWARKGFLASGAPSEEEHYAAEAWLEARAAAAAACCSCRAPPSALHQLSEGLLITDGNDRAD